MSIRVIAIGEPLAADDGVAFAVLEALKTTPLPDNVELVGTRDATRLIELLVDIERVIIIDAVLTASGSLQQLAPEDLAPSSANALSSHGVGTREAIELSRVLHPERVAKDITIAAIGIERPTQYGDSLSPELQAAIPGAVATIQTLLLG